MNWYLAYHRGKKPKVPQIKNTINILPRKKKKKKKNVKMWMPKQTKM